MGRSTAPLRIADYRRLLLSYVVNELGDSIAIVALAVLVFDRTGDAVATTALFIAAKFLPALISPVLVARVDRLPPNRSLPVIYVVEAAVFALLALVAHSAYALPLVLALALLDGTLALAGRGLARGAVANVLGPAELLREGNAMMNVGFGIAVVAGMGLGGVIVAAFGVSTGLLIDAASFAIVAAVVSRLRVAAPAEAAESQRSRERLRALWEHVRAHRVLRALLVGEGLALVFFTMILPIEVVYAKETLETGDAGFGGLLAAWNGGLLIGSLAYIRLRGTSPARLVLGSTAAIGAAYAGLALANELWVACLISVVGGLGNGFQWVSVMTLVQEATPMDLQARVVSLLESIGAAMPGVGFLLGGALTAIWSPRTAYAVAGIAVLALVAAAAVALTGDQRFSATSEMGPAPD